MGPLREFSLSEYARALFTANPGYYRVIVFVVTSEDVQSEGTVERSEAMAWLDGGLFELPEPIGSREYTDQHSTIALIYEFEQPGRGQQATFRAQSPLTAIDHLEKARIWTSLGG